MDKIKIQIDFGQKTSIVEAVLLAKFIREYTSYISTKRLLFRRLKEVKKSELCYLVFIPWKHREKELLVIKESEIVSDNFTQPTEWVNIDSFTSSTKEEYHDYFEIKDFWGYDFIYENRFFLAHVMESITWEPLEVLYKNMPELLSEEIDDE